MAAYRLSPAAQKSLKKIRAYSLENFGTERTKLYLQDLRDRMKTLARTPNKGLIREDLKVGHHSDFVGSHTIYYRILPSHIEIIDVLHQSMDPSKNIVN